MTLNTNIIFGGSMQNGLSSYVANNISAPMAGFTLMAGRYVLTVTATYHGSDAIGVQRLAGDGSTWINCHSPLSSDGIVSFDASPGTYRINVVNATAVTADIVALALA